MRDPGRQGGGGGAGDGRPGVGCRLDARPGAGGGRGRRPLAARRSQRRNAHQGEAVMAETAAAPQTGKPIIQIRDLRKTYRRDKQELTVLDGINREVPEGAFEALMGPSGSGKTTLLNLIAGIDSPTSGSIKVSGEEIANLSETARASWRASHIGFIFQFYNLMPVLSAPENVDLPLFLPKLPHAGRGRR